MRSYHRAQGILSSLMEYNMVEYNIRKVMCIYMCVFVCVCVYVCIHMARSLYYKTVIGTTL